MKKIKQIIAIMILLSIPVWMTAQPPHPNGGNTPGPGNTPVGGGTPNPSPVDGGVSILIAMGIAYGAKKIYQLKKEGY